MPIADGLADGLSVPVLPNASLNKKWSELLGELGNEFRGHPGIVLHHFPSATGRALDVYDGYDEIEEFKRFPALYPSIARYQPWISTLRTSPAGTPILGREVARINPTVIASSDSNVTLISEPYEDVVSRTRLFHGMGAGLWKDAHPHPIWSIFLVIFRVISDPIFSDEEFARLSAKVPKLCADIRNHPAVVELRSPNKYNAASDLSYTFNVALLYNGGVGIRESIVQFYIENSTDDPEEKERVVQNLEARPAAELDHLVSDLCGSIAGFTRTAHAQNLQSEAGDAPASASIETVSGLTAHPPLTLPDQISEADVFTNRARDPETGRKQSAVAFILNGWPAPYVRAGVLTMADFRRLDPTAYFALNRYLRDGGLLPEGVRIPTKREIVDEQLADEPRLREAFRLASAHSRRQGGRTT